jgi:hypothetical protein
VERALGRIPACVRALVLPLTRLQTACEPNRANVEPSQAIYRLNGSESLRTGSSRFKIAIYGMSNWLEASSRRVPSALHTGTQQWLYSIEYITLHTIITIEYIGCEWASAVDIGTGDDFRNAAATSEAGRARRFRAESPTFVVEGPESTEQYSLSPRLWPTHSTSALSSSCGTWHERSPFSTSV